ncbi:MAG: C39 family peptidase [bacterium]
MKKIILLLAVQACIYLSAQAQQVLPISQTKQEQTNWCWAASSKAILDYYKFVKLQCEIAEWTRTVAFPTYGEVDCCQDPNQGCNNKDGNYNFGRAGSIQEILIHFGNLQNQGGLPSTLEEITSDIQKNRLFVILLKWKGAPVGHFVVGHGISGDNIYYMDPNSVEGFHIKKYSDLLNPEYPGYWYGTNRITSNVGIDEPVNKDALSFHPNPFCSVTTLQTGTILKDACLAVYNSQGQQVRQVKSVTGKTVDFDRDNLPAGIYLIRLTQGNTYYTGRVVIRDN